MNSCQIQTPISSQNPVGFGKMFCFQVSWIRKSLAQQASDFNNFCNPWGTVKTKRQDRQTDRQHRETDKTRRYDKTDLVAFLQELLQCELVLEFVQLFFCSLTVGVTSAQHKHHVLHKKNNSIKILKFLCVLHKIKRRIGVTFVKHQLHVKTQYKIFDPAISVRTSQDSKTSTAC